LTVKLGQNTDTISCYSGVSCL